MPALINCLSNFAFDIHHLPILRTVVPRTYQAGCDPSVPNDLLGL